MASLFTRLLSIDDVRKRFVQFENEVAFLLCLKAIGILLFKVAFKVSNSLSLV